MIQGKIYPIFTAQDEPETEETSTPEEGTETPEEESEKDDEGGEEETSDI